MEVPLSSEILPGLWMGGTDDLDLVNRAGRLPSASDPKDFDAVVTLSAYSKPVGWYVHEFRYCIPDASLDEEHAQELEKIADWAYLQWKSGKQVLIRCQAGMNRSGHVMALILMRERMKPKAAIELIRSKRSEDALSNHSFVEYLLREL
jgi:protein-tyrosine phosphatase